MANGNLPCVCTYDIPNGTPHCRVMTSHPEWSQFGTVFSEFVLFSLLCIIVYCVDHISALILWISSFSAKLRKSHSPNFAVMGQSILVFEQWEICASDCMAYIGCFVVYLTDPCEGNTCQNGGTCIPDGTGTYSCACPTGYSDTNCETGQSMVVYMAARLSTTSMLDFTNFWCRSLFFVFINLSILTLQLVVFLCSFHAFHPSGQVKIHCCSFMQQW